MERHVLRKWQQEIDLIEEHEGSAWMAFEFKWKESERVRFSRTFTANYPGASTEVVLPEMVKVFFVMTLCLLVWEVKVVEKLPFDKFLMTNVNEYQVDSVDL